MYSVSQLYSSSGGAEGCFAEDSMPSITSESGTRVSTSTIAEYITSEGIVHGLQEKDCCGLLSKCLLPQACSSQLLSKVLNQTLLSSPYITTTPGNAIFSS